MIMPLVLFRIFYTEQGIEARKQWWREVLHGGDIEARVDDGSVDDGNGINLIRSKLQDDAEENIWIWAAQNKSRRLLDITG